MMMIKNSGYIPNTVPNPYYGKKLDQGTGVQNSSNTVKLDKISAPRKTDTIELSKHPVNNRPSLSHVRDQIVSELKEDKSVSFLETLKTQISSNQYKIDSKEIAKIILTDDKE